MLRLIFLCLVLFINSFAVKSQRATRLLDSLVSLYAQQNKFNGSVLVASKGTILLQKGYGYKDVAHKTKVDANSLYQWGSLTKQFTSALVMYLQEKGRLNINDKLSKYFPELPFADSVKVYHLLTHTSGIYNYTNDGGFMATEAVKPATLQKMLGLFKDYPLQFLPGSKFDYSNSNYYLLGQIIQKASGQPYEKIMRQVILQPLGLKTAGFDFAHEHSADKTIGYDVINGEDYKASGIVDSSVSFAAGALYGSVYNLYAWHKALQKGGLLTPASWKKVYTPLQGKYAFGWIIDTLYGKPVAEHDGGIFGYTSTIKRFPEDDVVIIVLSNSSSPKTAEIANNLAAIVFNKNVDWPKERAIIMLPEEKLKPLTGVYELMPGFTITVTLEKGALKAAATGQPVVNLLAENENSFYIDIVDAKLVFERDAAGTATGVSLIQSGHTMSGKKIK